MVENWLDLVVFYVPPQVFLFGTHHPSQSSDPLLIALHVLFQLIALTHSVKLDL